MPQVDLSIKQKIIIHLHRKQTYRLSAQLIDQPENYSAVPNQSELQAGSEYESGEETFRGRVNRELRRALEPASERAHQGRVQLGNAIAHPAGIQVANRFFLQEKANSNGQSESSQAGHARVKPLDAIPVNLCEFPVATSDRPSARLPGRPYR